jgi:hypothetical protein
MVANTRDLASATELCDLKRRSEEKAGEAESRIIHRIPRSVVWCYRRLSSIRITLVSSEILLNADLGSSEDLSSVCGSISDFSAHKTPHTDEKSVKKSVRH